MHQWTSLEKQHLLEPWLQAFEAGNAGVDWFFQQYDTATVVSGKPEVFYSTFVNRWNALTSELDTADDDETALLRNRLMSWLKVLHFKKKKREGKLTVGYLQRRTAEEMVAAHAEFVLKWQSAINAKDLATHGTELIVQKCNEKGKRQRTSSAEFNGGAKKMKENDKEIDDVTLTAQREELEPMAKSTAQESFAVSLVQIMKQSNEQQLALVEQARLREQALMEKLLDERTKRCDEAVAAKEAIHRAEINHILLANSFQQQIGHISLRHKLERIAARIISKMQTVNVKVGSTTAAFKCLREELREVHAGRNSPLSVEVRHFERWCQDNGKNLSIMLKTAEELFGRVSGWAHHCFSDQLDIQMCSSPTEYEVARELFDAFGEPYVNVDHREIKGSGQKSTGGKADGDESHGRV
ncbi:hypothetical protein HDU88_004643 [Geranomyces variabilis]|nr:hypothetical protein HDU88_004643 [Geranomyces variabilis]